jgi:hypothetical protein
MAALVESEGSSSSHGCKRLQVAWHVLCALSELLDGVLAFLHTPSSTVPAEGLAVALLCACPAPGLRPADRLLWNAIVVWFGHHPPQLSKVRRCRSGTKCDAPVAYSEAQLSDAWPTEHHDASRLVVAWMESCAWHLYDAVTETAAQQSLGLLPRLAQREPALLRYHQSFSLRFLKPE